jgi:hypothetical protein
VHELLLTHEAYGNDWLKEHRVTVGQVAGKDVSGNADLYHADSGTVIDFKIVGASTLNEARRHGSKLQYQRQIQLYGRGFVKSYGYDVSTVFIDSLPRSPGCFDCSRYPTLIERPSELQMFATTQGR